MGLICLMASWALDVQDTKLQFTDQTSSDPDIWAELRMLRDVVEQKAELLLSKTSLEELRRENTEQSAELTDLRARLGSSERRVEELKVELENQAAELSSTQARVADGENGLLLLQDRMDDVQAQNTVQDTERSSVKDRTNTSEHRVDILIKQSAKVVFYAALTNSGDVGPYNTATVLRFSKVFTNIGKAYSPTTGFFTAPVKGVYFFRFTVCGHREEGIGVQLFHNKKSIIYNVQSWPYNSESHFEYQSNAVILELNAGDELYLVLPEWDTMFDNLNNHSTFSGFLLFSM
ncbi:golgin subfamily A member 3-like [Lates japonicus]